MVLQNEEINRQNDSTKSLNYGRWLSHPAPGEEIVISGLAGSYPNSHNVYEFRDNLYNKVDMVSDDDRRWKLKHPEIPQRMGKLYDIEKFDAGYFGVHENEAHTMYPIGRLFMEKSIEAIFDAGMNPSELEGTNTGIFFGICFAESQKFRSSDNIHQHCSAITGCMRAMIANRLSYHLKLKGPSFIVDTACSSSSYAIEHAYKAIRNGDCEMAIVGAGNSCLHPSVSLQFARLGVLSPDGACKVFDDRANGYARSEGSIAVLLQKSKDARRIYAEIIHAKTNCDGYKGQGITYPSGNMQKKLINEFYEECNIDQTTLSYLEVHGTGTSVGDFEEAVAMDEVFCTGRETPLLAGSVKSNIGHGEPVSGLSSITKAIISMENGLIPPNLHYNKHREGVEGLEKGRMKIVTNNTPFVDDRGLIGLNSFGFGGSNCHILLRWNKKQKINKGLPKDNLPRLVCISGRKENSVISFLDDIKDRTLDAEYIRLLHHIFSKNIVGHFHRGYTIVSKSGELRRSVKYSAVDKKPLYLIFSSFVSSWGNVTNNLLTVPLFVGSIQRIQNILSPLGINLMDILLNGDSTSNFDQILGNMAVQIGIADIIKNLDILPNGLLGYGLGEFICGYFDGSLSLEQIVLSMYHIALDLNNCEKTISYVIGLDEDEAKSAIPSHIHITKIISAECVLISGKLQHLGDFISNLTVKGVFVQEVESHLSYFQSKEFSILKPKIMAKLNKIINKPNGKNTKFKSAEYFLQTLSNSEINLCEINKNDLILEIGNEHLLSTKQNIRQKFNHLYYNQDQKENNFVALLELLGSLYEHGYNFEIDKLYPTIEYPVSRCTPMISPLIKWNHDHNWFVTSYYAHKDTQSQQESVANLSMKDDKWQFVTGHVIDGRNLFPATGYLSFAWEALATATHMIPTDLQIVIENCKFHRATNITPETNIPFHIYIQKSSHNFEILEDQTVVVSGKIYAPTDFAEKQLNLPTTDENKDEIPLKTKDVYKELRLRGYYYSGAFKQIVESNKSATKAFIRWNGNWISFLDNMLQLKILQLDTRLLYIPTGIKSVSIDFKRHLFYVKTFAEDEPLLPVYFYKDLDIVKCGGIEIRGIEAASIARRKIRADPVLENYCFVPNQSDQLDLKDLIRVNVQLAIENKPGIKIKSVELFNETCRDDIELLSPLIHQILGDIPLIQANIIILSDKKLNYSEFTIENKALSTETDCNFVIGENILQRTMMLNQALGALKENGCILAREPIDFEINLSEYDGIEIITEYRTNNEKIILARKKTEYKPAMAIKISNENFDWLPQLQNAIKNDSNVVVYAQNEPLSGVLGLINCIRREPGGGDVKCVFVQDEAPIFDPNNSFYSEQLKKNLAINVYQNSKWGTYRHLTLPEMKEVDREHCYVNVTVRGDLSSLRWIEGPLTSNNILSPEQELIYVYYSALNFRDVMTATGRLNADVISMDRTDQECVQGIEFSGRNAAGKRYMGMLVSGALSTLVAADKYLMWEVPDNWTLEDAGTVPVVYATVIYCFFWEHKLKRGETILIHSGTGGVGQAAIHIALHHGCTVYTTVSTKEKREFLKKHFPKLTDQHIGNSRDTSFEQMIYDRTNGRGVDLVLNSLAEDKLLASVRCLAQGGKFFEIGKFDFANNNPLRLMFLEKGTSFHGIVIDHFFHKEPVHKQMFNSLIKRAITDGYIKPLPRTVFKDDEIEQAFRYMTTGKHIGKVLIEVRKEEMEKNTAPSFLSKRGIPRYYCNPHDSYVIVGGLGGLGLELADWLILRGARKLILTSRKGLSTGYQSYRIKIWTSYGCCINISTADVTTKKGCEQLIEEANELGPVAAIFNLAVVLKDALLENQTIENFLSSFEPKAYATKYLDEVTRKLCPQLRNFVVFSSVSCGRGNAGQTNYGMSNSVMERICEKRKEDGLPATAIEWGAVGEVGIVAEMQEENTEIEIGGTLQQRISNCLQVLDVLLIQNNAIVSSIVVAEKKGGVGGADNIIDAVANILGLRDVKTVSLHATLPELGMDSMNGVEIKQTLEREFEVYLTATDIRSLTFARLLEIQEERNSDSTTATSKTEKMIEGVNLLLRFVGDEDDFKLPLIAQKTLATNYSTAAKLLFLPGIEGVAKVLDPLTSNLHVHATAAQFSFDTGVNTIEEIVKNILPHIEKTISKTKPFNMVAYSYGAVIAVELVGLLEAKGYIGHLISIDGSYTMFSELTKKLLEVESEAQLQTSLLCQVMTHYVSFDIIFSHKTRILQCATFTERLDIAAEIFPKDSVSHSVDYCRRLITGLYNRIKNLIEYQPKFSKLKSKLTLFKPEQATITGIADDYNLSELCENPIEVKIFKGNHVTILENLELAEAIDQSFEENQVVIKNGDVNDKVDLGKQHLLKGID